MTQYTTTCLDGDCDYRYHDPTERSALHRLRAHVEETGQGRFERPVYLARRSPRFVAYFGNTRVGASYSRRFTSTRFRVGFSRQLLPPTALGPLSRSEVLARTWQSRQPY